MQMDQPAFVDMVSLLFLSPKVMLKWDPASARTFLELKAQSLFTLAQGINSCRDKTIQLLQALPCLRAFFSSYILLTSFIHPKNVLYLSPPTQGFSSKLFTSPPSSKEAFFPLCRFFNLKDVCVTKNKKKKSCLFVLSSTQVSF